MLSAFAAAAEEQQTSQAPPPQTRRTPLHLAAMSGNLAMIKVIANAPNHDFFLTDKDHKTRARPHKVLLNGFGQRHPGRRMPLVPAPSRRSECTDQRRPAAAAPAMKRPLA